MFHRLVIGLVFITGIFDLSGQDEVIDQITIDVAFLSSDLLEGRGTGTAGEEKAAVYISQRFTALNLEPLDSNFVQKFLAKRQADPHGISSEEVLSRNVVGFLDFKAPYTVVLGAHYDHLGYGGQHVGSRHVGEPEIHNGADDNASGVALILDLARVIQVENLDQFNFLFVAFSGEELGHLGSKFFVEHMSFDLDIASIACMLNFDMVGRLNEDKILSISGVGTSPFWKKAMSEIDVHNIQPKLSSSGIGPSDHTSFYLKEIPALHFFTGQHNDYHKPGDDSHLINYKGIREISDFILELLKRLNKSAKKPVFQKTKDPAPRQAASFKVTLGIMPDYVYAGVGLRIDAVMGGRPAQNAGMESGDVIVKMDEMEIGDIYDYMEALATYKSGDQSKVVVKRGEQLQSYSVTF